MPTKDELIEELFAMMEALAFDGALTIDEVEELDCIKSTYYLIKSVEEGAE